jgi:Spy/CpxP family protein refolding chaperone
MHRKLYPILALTLVAAPATLVAQTREAPRAEARGAMQSADPIGRVLTLRSELGLTDEQVARLEAIRSRLAEKNRPLVEQLRSKGAELREEVPGGEAWLTPEQRQELRERWEAMTPEERAQRREEIRKEIRERREAMTPEQREELRKRMEERRNAMRERMEELRPILQQLGENNRQAMEEARSVLTAEQRTRLEELRKQRAAERGRRPGPRGGRGWGSPLRPR